MNVKMLAAVVYAAAEGVIDESIEDAGEAVADEVMDRVLSTTSHWDDEVVEKFQKFTAAFNARANARRSAAAGGGG